MIKSAYFCLQNYNHTARVKDMIRELGWVTLEKRLMKNRLTQMCKIKYNLPDNKWKKYLRLCDETCTCGSRIKYSIPTKDELKQQNILPKYSCYQIPFHLVKHMTNLHHFIFSLCFIFF